MNEEEENEEENEEEAGRRPGVAEAGCNMLCTQPRWSFKNFEEQKNWPGLYVVRQRSHTLPGREPITLLKKGALKWLPGSKVARFFQSRFHHENGPLTV